MNVKELIALLEKVENKERIVICQKDSEGNGHSPLSEIGDSLVYKATTTWCGDVGYEKLTEELEKQGYCEEDVIADGQPCLILYPIN